jgi:hypothetical protein
MMALMPFDIGLNHEKKYWPAFKNVHSKTKIRNYKTTGKRQWQT